MQHEEDRAGCPALGGSKVSTERSSRLVDEELEQEGTLSVRPRNEQVDERIDEEETSGSQTKRRKEHREQRGRRATRQSFGRDSGR
jgi:hypothetical protein